MEICPGCRGAGELPGGRECPSCRGHAVVAAASVQCPSCDGSGIFTPRYPQGRPTRCGACQGTGRLAKAVPFTADHASTVVAVADIREAAMGGREEPSGGAGRAARRRARHLAAAAKGAAA